MITLFEVAPTVLREAKALAEAKTINGYRDRSGEQRRLQRNGLRRVRYAMDRCLNQVHGPNKAVIAEALRETCIGGLLRASK